MSLEEYYKKRKFKKTSEPAGKVEETGLSRFVVHEHQATHLHFDFRLEMDGVLKSWAVPKGIPKETGIKHLAVQTEDHPVDYIDFKGEIPPGEYGAGLVKIWDKGSYKLLERTKRSLKFQLSGNRLEGVYVLLSTPWKKRNEWLIFKTEMKTN